MIDSKISVSYDDIKQFLLGKEETGKIYQLSDKYPVFGIFISIQKLSSPLINFSENSDFTFDDVEAFLQNYLAGSLSVQEATKILNAVTTSRENFDKLLYKINENIKAIEETSLHNKAFEPQQENQKIIAGLALLRKKFVDPSHYFFNHRKKMAYSVLSMAAVLLILFLSPIRLQNGWEDYYNFDTNVPLEYLNFSMRESNLSILIKDREIQDFKNQFNRGMADYLANDYRSAINELDMLNNKLPALKEKPEFKIEYENQYYLYAALSRLSLAVSKKEDISDNEKEMLIKKALTLFNKVPLNRDFEKYYYALCLALDKQDDKALENLKLIDENSVYINNKIVLEEQISLRKN